MPEPLKRSHLAAIPRLALRSREAAEALGISERTLWGWTQNGDVPHVRRGGTLLYPTAELERWLGEQAGEAAAGADGRIRNPEPDDAIEGFVSVSTSEGGVKR
ncbi:MAG: helix-turn-helix domain-containing protein [Phycisphaerae bacterium]